MFKVNIANDWTKTKNLIVVDVSAVMRTKYTTLYTPQQLLSMGSKAKYIRQNSYVVNGETVNTSAMYGLLQLFSLYGIHHDYIFCFDAPYNLLKQIDANYKGNRVKMGDEYFDQVNTMYKWLTQVGFRTMFSEGYEGDHLVAKAVYDNKYAYDNIAIISNDKDLASLVDTNVYWVDTLKKRTDISRENYTDVLGCPYNANYLMKAMVGDNSDNIKGIFRFGQKRFSKFLIEEGIRSEEIFSNEQKIIENATTLTDEQKAQALHCLQLIVPLVVQDPTVSSVAVPTSQIDTIAMYNFLEKYGMKSISKLFNLREQL